MEAAEWQHPDATTITSAHLKFSPASHPPTTIRIPVPFPLQLANNNSTCTHLAFKCSCCWQCQDDLRRGVEIVDSVIRIMPFCHRLRATGSGNREATQPNWNPETQTDATQCQSSGRIIIHMRIRCPFLYLRLGYGCSSICICIWMEPAHSSSHWRSRRPGQASCPDPGPTPVVYINN